MQNPQRTTYKRPPKASSPTLDESLARVTDWPNMPLTMEHIAALFEDDSKLSEAIRHDAEFRQDFKKFVERITKSAIEKEKVFERSPIDPSLY